MNYSDAWLIFRRKYSDFFDNILRTGSPDPIKLDKLRDSLGDMLQWANVTAAARMRRQAGLPVKTPKSKTLQAVIEANPFLEAHLEATDPLVRQRTLWVAESEGQYLEAVAAATRAVRVGKKPPSPLWRAERIRRDQVGEITNVAEQVQLSVPEIGGQFPFAEYHTRDDARVRPTHALMNNFVALRTWAGWKKIRPRCGYNCRCYVIFVSLFEAKRNGWIGKDGKVKFEVKWPNSKSKWNYEHGLFPDKGWGEGKFWAA
jgi:hypothetical protein